MCYLRIDCMHYNHSSTSCLGLNITIITFQMTREYAKDREEYFREFHSVVAPVVVLDGYEYERKYDEEPSFCLHPDE